MFLKTGRFILLAMPAKSSRVLLYSQVVHFKLEATLPGKNGQADNIILLFKYHLVTSIFCILPHHNYAIEVTNFAFQIPVYPGP